MRHPYDKYRVAGSGPVETRTPERIMVNGKWRRLGLARCLWFCACILVYRWLHPGEYK